MVQKNIWPKNFLGPKYILVKRSLVEKMLSTKIKAPKNLGPKSLIEMGSVLAELLLIWANAARIYMLPGKLSPWQLASVKDCPRIKIDSVTAEILLIFLIWTNVGRTNVVWTNVTLTVGICSTCSQEPTFKVSSKSGQ